MLIGETLVVNVPGTSSIISLKKTLDQATCSPPPSGMKTRLHDTEINPVETRVSSEKRSRPLLHFSSFYLSYTPVPMICMLHFLYKASDRSVLFIQFEFIKSSEKVIKNLTLHTQTLKMTSIIFLAEIFRINFGRISN